MLPAPCPSRSRHLLCALAAPAALAGAMGMGCHGEAPLPEATPPPAVSVSTVPAEKKVVDLTLPVTGTVEAIDVTALAAGASGKVTKVLVDRGDEVSKGQQVIAIDTRLPAVQTQVAAAQAAARTAEAELQAEECRRTETLAAAGAITQAELDRQKWTCKIAARSAEAARLQVAAASLSVTDGRIVAPFAGHVGERFVQVGEHVQAQSPVITLVSLDPLKVVLTVPEAHLAALQEGKKVQFRVAAWPRQTFVATLARVSPTVRPETRDLVVEATVANPDKKLRPGMFVKAELPVGKTNAVLIPMQSVVASSSDNRVFVVKSGRIEERLISLGEERENTVVVTQGVSSGDLVVRNPTRAVRNGARPE